MLRHCRLWNNHPRGNEASSQTASSLARSHDMLEAVHWGYRLFLDREPESRDVVAEKTARVKSYADLREEFLTCEEYRQRNPIVPATSMSGNEPGLRVDLALSKSDLDDIFQHIQRAWEQLGKTEPYWSVLTADPYTMSNIEHSRDEFYRSGEFDASRFMKTLERCGIAGEGLQSCLEYGCGIGRVTYWLAHRFNSVVACDISEPHLRLAEEHMAASDMQNVTFLHLADLRDLPSLPHVDAIFSILVLQHNPPPVIRFVIDGLLKTLNPGGVAYFQVPTYRDRYEFYLRTYLAVQAKESEMEMHLLPQREVFEVIHENGCRVLEVIEDQYAGVAPSALSNTFVVQKGQSA